MKANSCPVCSANLSHEYCEYCGWNKPKDPSVPGMETTQAASNVQASESPHPAEAGKKSKNTIATMCLVLGIIAVVLFFVPWGGIVLAALALLLCVRTFVKKQANGKVVAGVALGVLAMILSISFTSTHMDNVARIRERDRAREEFIAVPNVIGVNYEEAQRIVENAGFTATVSPIDAEQVVRGAGTWRQGDVIRMNDSTSGQDRHTSPIAPDGHVILFYAREDFTIEATPTPEPTPTPETTPTPEQDQEAAPEADVGAPTIDWKSWIAEYERWIDDYIDLLERFAANPLDPAISSAYMASMTELIEWAERAEQLEGELSGDDLREYTAALQRIMNRLLEAQLP